MKVAIRNLYGPPEVLSIQIMPKPTPKPNEILIKVYATTVNRTDCGALWGQPYIFRFFVGWPKPRHGSTGTDFAGMVEAVGEKVTQFKVGDRVWGFDDNCIGTHAQYVTLPANGSVLVMPANCTYEQAAASAEGAHYAINFINKIKLQPSHHVLVNGATGAIGSAAVQLLKHYGAKVTAVADTPNLEKIKKLGADIVIDYTQQDFTKTTEKYNYVLDAVGKSQFAKCKPLLMEGGAYISSELGPGNENLYLPLLTLFSNKKSIFPFPHSIKKSLQLIQTLLENGEFSPLIARTYPLEKIAEAYTFVASGQKIGNVMISFWDKELG